MVPFGDFHMDLWLNSLTLSFSGVLFVHLIPTLHSRMARAVSRVTWLSVASRYSTPSSKCCAG